MGDVQGGRDACIQGEHQQIDLSRWFSGTYGSGEISLPGGKAEENDKDDGITATREAEEEIGLDPSLVDVVAFLEPFLSQHLLRVIPVIGILWDRKAFNPTPSPAEVEAVFDAPFEMFLKDENRRSEEIDWMGEKHLVVPVVDGVQVYSMVEAHKLDLSVAPVSSSRTAISRKRRIS
ncbi:unnamed protein product [Arabidopsis arenosa]|uniref:Nudix hydrolase domain-containing protein n=1 Tax=Arabidopsis arenosa TaxID=38785 RepID=A0A8S2A8H3_ARAAE|nr:unnamed protein product [Arabidopsis arenosa]